MRPLFGLLLSLLIAAPLTSCNYTRYKRPVGRDGLGFGDLRPIEKSTMMNFEFINSRILRPKCASCHGDSGNVSLETYSAVKSHIAGIRNTVFIERTMPKRGALTLEEKRLLWNWIELGAPAESDGAPPPEEPLRATYESIRSHILEPQCMTCHHSTGTGKRVPLDKQGLLTSPLELVIPGNADESGLIISLERADDKRMPPAKEGYAALRPDVIQVLREWINSGAD